MELILAKEGECGEWGEGVTGMLLYYIIILHIMNMEIENVHKVQEHSQRADETQIKIQSALHSLLFCIINLSQTESVRYFLIRQ